jgi:hypothetical protein
MPFLSFFIYFSFLIWIEKLSGQLPDQLVIIPQSLSYDLSQYGQLQQADVNNVRYVEI